MKERPIPFTDILTSRDRTEGELVMKERPILFSGPMVRAILDGRKTMTRRVVNPQPVTRFNADGEFGQFTGWLYRDGGSPCPATGEPVYVWLPIRSMTRSCPYGQSFDRLLVKEAAWVWCHKKPNGLTPTGRPKYAYEPVGQHVLYAVDHSARPTTPVDDNPDHCWRFKIPRYLPGWAVRTELEIVRVRVQRLQDISEEDAAAEGAVPGTYYPRKSGPGRNEPRTHRDAFNHLWDSLNAERGFGWDANPWVWAITFRKVRG